MKAGEISANNLQMLQNLQNFVEFPKYELDNLVDFEKCCKTRIYLQRSAPIQPKTSEVFPKFCQKLATTLWVHYPTGWAYADIFRAWPSVPRAQASLLLEIYALEIQMCTQTKNSARMKEIYPKTINLSSVAFPQPDNTGVQHFREY